VTLAAALFLSVSAAAAAIKTPEKEERVKHVKYGLALYSSLVSAPETSQAS
jgi:hypothetical protein